MLCQVRTLRKTEIVTENSNMVTSGDDDPFTPVTKHSDTLQEIANSDAPDAHIHRVLLALACGEDPDSDDLDQILGAN